MRTEDEAWEAWNTRPVEDELRAEVKEWLCITCRTVFPGPPQQGLKCVICPRCGGDTAPMNSVLLHEAHAEVERLTARLAEATEIIRFFYARTQAGFSLQKAAWTCPWCDKDTSATGDGSWTHESWCPWQRAAAWLAAQEAE